MSAPNPANPPTPSRPVCVWFTVQEANEVAYAATVGFKYAYVTPSVVEGAIKRLEAAAKVAEESGAQ